MTQKPKILMLLTQLGYGGAETSFIRLANFLAQSMDVTVALFTSDYGNKGAYAQGHVPMNASVVLLDGDATTGRLHRWWRRIKMVRELKATHDVTISFLSGPNLVNVLAGHNATSIVSVRGSRVYDPVASRLSRLFFQHIIDPIVFWLAAKIVPVSAGLKNEIRQAAGEKVLEKTCVISPFVEPDVLQERRAENLPEPYANLKGQNVMVSVGRLSVEKGFHHLIRVFAELSKTYKGAKLLLVGDGPMLHDLRAQCIKLGLRIDSVAADATSVIFAGYQKNALPFMALGKVYAMTSATEGFPSVVLEAMAAGVPVVASNTPWGVRTILLNNGEVSAEPYPTSSGEFTDYGLLMPRIDKPEYQKEWVQTLGGYLSGEVAPNIKAVRRVRDYDLAIVGEQWKKLIEEITTP